jgi:hypothetical protein
LGVVIFIARGGDTSAVHLVAMTTGASLSVLLVGWLVRLGNAGDRERIAEEEAREYFARHGRWPDEQ